MAQFIQFVMHSPPGTAVFYEKYEHWNVTDFLLTDLLEMQDLLLCAKSADPKKAMRKLKRRWRPGMKTEKQIAAEAKSMTVADYVKRTGMKINLGEEVN